MIRAEIHMVKSRTNDPIEVRSCRTISSPRRGRSGNRETAMTVAMYLARRLLIFRLTSTGKDWQKKIIGRCRRTRLVRITTSKRREETREEEERDREKERIYFPRRAAIWSESEKERETSMKHISRIYVHDGTQSEPMTLDKGTNRGLRRIGVPLPCRPYRRHQPMFRQQRDANPSSKYPRRR